MDERGEPDRDGGRVVESAPSGRNPRGLGDTDNIGAQRALEAMNLAADRGLNTVTNRLEWRWGS